MVKRFTPLSGYATCGTRHDFPKSIPLEDFFRSLNEFFDCTAGAVLEHGGEVLSYIGDAVLAIFTIAGTDRPLAEACFREEGACAAALAAAREAQARVDALNQRRVLRGEPPLEFGLALHVGDVMYGNLGVPQRLQFTVIGAAANEAARLAGMCKDLKRWILLSSAFPRCFSGQMVSLGHHVMRGMDTPEEIFTLTTTSEAGAQCITNVREAKSELRPL